MPISAPPSMNISFLHPVIEPLAELGCSEDELATKLSVTEEQLREGGLQIPANVVYRFLTWAAEYSGDQYFSLNCGRRMASGFWAPILPLFEESRSVGDFLTKFSALATEAGRAATYRLEVEGKVALWSLSRPKGASPDSVQADAMAVGFFCEVLKQASEPRWEPGEVVAVISDASLIPTTFLPATSVITGSEGMKLRVPTEALSQELGSLKREALPDPEVLPNAQPIAVVQRVSEMLKANLSKPGYGIKEVAESLGLKRWKLQATLKEQGTNLTELKNKMRRQTAIQRVGEEEETISEIAKDLGYVNRTNFTRAFRSWTGKSPKVFREERD